jgi:hypothetical protein
VALVRQGRIHVSVAHNELPCRKRGFHSIIQMLYARSRIQQSLAFIGHFRIVCVEQNAADFLGNFFAARLAGENMRNIFLV